MYNVDSVVVGGAGHVGWALVKQLVKSGEKVLIYDKVQRVLDFRDTDRSNLVFIYDHTKNLEKYNINCKKIFHLGEYARVEQSHHEVINVLDDNLSGTTEVIKYWLNNNCKLIYTGSSTKFGDEDSNRYRSPYGITKHVNTELIKCLGALYNKPYVTVYLSNVYGPGEVGTGIYATVIEKFLQCAARGEKVKVTSPGTQTRKFTHVYDTVNGILTAAESLEGDECVICSDEEYSIIEICGMMNVDYELVGGNIANRQTTRINNDKLKSLGWSQMIRLRDYIEERL